MTYSEFKKAYSIRLNPQQEAAVRQVSGPVLLLAVPVTSTVVLPLPRSEERRVGKECRL